jgi:hypothetical protein
MKEEDNMWMRFARFEVLRIIKMILISNANDRNIPIDYDFLDRVSKKLENVLFFSALDYIVYADLKTIECRLYLLYHNRKILSKSPETIEGYDDKSFEYILDMDERFVTDFQPNDLNCLL